MSNELAARAGAQTWAFPAFTNFIEDWFKTPSGPAALRPAMDVEEDENQLTIRTELPGIPKDDVEITLEDGVLTIAGEKRSDRETKEKSYHFVERRFGSYRRTLNLPSGVDADKAEASFENGVLTVIVPKSETIKPRKVTIK